MDDDDLELDELHAKIKEMTDFLIKQFDANCAEDDYTEGCLSCDAGMAVKHLRRMMKIIGPLDSKGGDAK